MVKQQQVLTMNDYTFILPFSTLILSTHFWKKARGHMDIQIEQSWKSTRILWDYEFWNMPPDLANRGGLDRCCFFVVEMCQVLFLDIDGVLHPAVPHGEVFRPERHGGKWQWLARCDDALSWAMWPQWKSMVLRILHTLNRNDIFLIRRMSDGCHHVWTRSPRCTFRFFLLRFPLCTIQVPCSMFLVTPTPPWYGLLSGN